MREIKFRAWHKSISPAFGKGLNATWFYSDENLCFPDGNAGYFEDLKDMDIMQFTGLKDKNGKEIYEGDILLTRAKMKEVVKKESICGDGYMPIIGYGYMDYYETYGVPVEIIGNIYQNKELLK